jgi:hypothetical protein
MQAEDLLRLTYALLRPETAAAAVRALRGNASRPAVEGLTELIYRPRTATEAVAAIAALESIEDPLIFDVTSPCAVRRSR